MSFLKLIYFICLFMKITALILLIMNFTSVLSVYNLFIHAHIQRCILYYFFFNIKVSINDMSFCYK